MKKRSYTPIVLFIIIIFSLVGINFLLEYGIVGVNESSEISRIESIKDHVKVHFIDVGQGDSIFIQIKNKNILIDAGEAKEAPTVVNYLKTYNVKKLDYVFLTHPHEDHLGGLSEIIDTFEIGKFYAPNVGTVTRSYENLLNSLKNKSLDINRAKAGLEFNFAENIKLELFSPGKDEYSNLNNYSPIMKLTYNETSFLFTGDAEEETEKEVISGNYNLKSDVLKAGHHGSNTSSIQEFLEEVKPQFTVITSGKSNRFNLPNEEIVERHKNIGSKVLMTEKYGNIVFSTDGRDIRLLTNWQENF